MTPHDHLLEAERLAKELKDTPAEEIARNPDIVIAAATNGILHTLLAEVSLHVMLHERLVAEAVALGDDIGPDGAPRLRSVPPGKPDGQE